MLPTKGPEHLYIPGICKLEWTELMTSKQLSLSLVSSAPQPLGTSTGGGKTTNSSKGLKSAELEAREDICCVIIHCRHILSYRSYIKL